MIRQVACAAGCPLLQCVRLSSTRSLSQRLSESAAPKLQAHALQRFSRAAGLQSGPVLLPHVLLSRTLHTSGSRGRDDEAFPKYWCAAVAAAAGLATSQADASGVSLADSKAQQAQTQYQHQHHGPQVGSHAFKQTDQHSHDSATPQIWADSLQGWYNRATSWLTAVLQQSSDEHVAVKLLALSAALLPVILASGFLYRLASGVSLSQAFYKMYCLLYRIETGKEPNVLSYLVSNGVFILGFFTLALLLGVVNDEVQRRSDDARMGRNPVHCKDHVLLLNWNQSSPALLRNIATAISASQSAAAATAAASRPATLWAANPTVVVLADADKSAMDAAVQEAVKDRGLKLTVHTREGNPFKPSHLRKVAARDASVVILLHPDHVGSAADAEAMKAAAAMSLSTLQQPSAGATVLKKQHMIVQMPSSVPAEGNMLHSLLHQASANDSSSSSSCARDGLQLQVLAMPDDTLVNRMVAQTAAQPGLLTCWQDIMAPAAGSSHFCCMPIPQELQQQPYMDIRRAFQRAVVVGYTDAEGQLHLNPDDSAVPGPGSKLIQLSRWGPVQPDAAAAGVFTAAAESAAQRWKSKTAYKAKARNVIVASWPAADVPELMRSCNEFMPPGSTVTFVSQQQLQPAWTARRFSNCSFKFITHPYPTSTQALGSAGISSASSVVLGTGAAADRLSDTEADARVLAAMLQVQEAVLSANSPRAPHVVAPIREHGSSSMALKYLQDLAARLGHGAAAAAAAGDVSSAAGDVSSAAGASSSSSSTSVVKPEFLVFRDVTSAVLTQVVSERAYADIITELLFSSEGQEMYLRSPASFNIPLGVPIKFAEVAELARLTKQTALGYIDTDNSDALGGGSSSTGAKHSSASLSSLSAAASVYLGLGASDTVVFTEGDWVVVLAEEF